MTDAPFAVELPAPLSALLPNAAPVELGVQTDTSSNTPSKQPSPMALALKAFTAQHAVFHAACKEAAGNKRIDTTEVSFPPFLKF